MPPPKNRKNTNNFSKQSFKRKRGFNQTLIIKDSDKVEKRKYRHQDQLTEQDVGITEYISKLEGYSAVIKARYSDFQVNEINLDGKLAKLTDISVPPDFDANIQTKSYKETIESPLKEISQDTWDALKKLVEENGEPVELEANNMTKDQRRDIYDCVKSYFAKHIVATTIKKNDSTFLQFKKWDKNSNDSNRENRWPKDSPEFVHFIVYKEQIDTMNACFKVAQFLRISPTKITYAGVKDKRAKTTQWFCIKKYEPSKLVKKTQHLTNLKVGNVELKDSCLKIGALSGNRFRIALRNVAADDELIEKSIEHVIKHGFINYYGLQRFGNDKEVPTFSIGIKLLQGQWKEAVDLILKAKVSDDPTKMINTAKRVYAETGDAVKAFKLCDKRFNDVEKRLLEGLAKNKGNNYVVALDSIPKAIRLMYIHAYQSLIWNKMASKRINKYGFNPVEGDLIFLNNTQEDEDLVDDNLENNEEEATNISPQNEPKKMLVRALRADELNKYTIFDIVLPLPGYDIIYPEHLKQDYKEAIEECGLTLEMPKQKVKAYNLSGAYRKLVQHAKDFEWKIMYYNEPTDNLIRSDLEELEGEEEPQSVEDGKYKAVVVSFTLNSSSYATMVLRDILKCNTSSSIQAGLNDYAEPGKQSLNNDEILDESSGSLLADKEKYETFKKNLFNDILKDANNESETSRCEAEESENPSKKLKIDEN